jgi:hypothetical protein
MRYAKGEIPVAVGSLPATGTVTVQVCELVSNTMLNVTTDLAVQTPVTPDLNGRVYWAWPLTNIADPITGFAQLLIVFTNSDTGERDEAKILVRGIYDKVSRIQSLVAAQL